MGDLLPGSKVKGLDTPPTVGEDENDSYTVTITGYGTAVASGTYADCGKAFVGPTSGRVLIHYKGQIGNGSSYTALSPQVRNGSTIGSGTEVLAADDTHALVQNGAEAQAGQTDFVEGLTPGAAYNVRLLHKVGGGTGTVSRRSVDVEAVP